MQHKNNVLYKRSLAAITVLLLLYAISTVPAQTVPQIAEKALAATVYLEMKDKSGKTLGIGSGFFVKPNLIATNYHVIEGAAKGTAKLVGKYTTYDIEGVTATDKVNDLALLKVTAYDIKPLSLGDSDAVKVGEAVHVTGNLTGLEGAFLNGTVNWINSGEDAPKWIHIIGTSISPISSGVPVFDNSKWSVIGVFVSTPSVDLSLGAENLDHVISVNVLKVLLKQSGTVVPLSQKQQSISAETYYRWGYRKHKLGDYNGAITNYDIAIQLRSDYALAYYNRGVAKEMLKQYFAASVDYNIANRLKPGAAALSNSKGDLASVLGGYKGSISYYDMAIRLNPDYAQAYHNRGKAKFNLEKYFEAISDYDMAIRLKPNYAEVYDDRGLAKSRLGQHTVAIADFDTAIRLKPNYALVYHNRGLAKYSLKNYASAITDYDKAIQLNPRNALAYLNRGGAKAELGQHFEAISDIDMFIRLRPDNPHGYSLRGYVKGGKLEQHAAAIVDYDKAIQIKPDHVPAYYGRGVSRIQLGHTSEAKQDLQTALKLAEKTGDARLKTEIEAILQKVP